MLEVEAAELRQVGEVGGDPTREPVVAEAQDPELTQPADRAQRDIADEPHPGQTQVTHGAPTRVACDPNPVAGGGGVVPPHPAPLPDLSDEGEERLPVPRGLRAGKPAQEHE